MQSSAHRLAATVLLAVLGACGAVPAPERPLVVVSAQEEVVHVHEGDPEPRFFRLRREDGATYWLQCRDIGRGGYAVDAQEEACPYTGFEVVMRTQAGPEVLLAFVHDGPEGERGIAVYRQSDDEVFDLLARTEGDVHAYDWAVVSGDTSTVAVWGDVLDVYERRGDRLVPSWSVRETFVKCFPVVSHDGRVAARMIERGREGEAVVLDGVVGPMYDRVKDPVFSRDGEHLAYVARRDGESFLVVDGVPHDAPADHRVEATYPGTRPERSRHLVFEQSTWRPGKRPIVVVWDPEVTEPPADRIVPPRTDLPIGPVVPPR